MLLGGHGRGHLHCCKLEFYRRRGRQSYRKLGSPGRNVLQSGSHQSEVRVTASIGLCYGGIKLLVLARRGCLYCRLASELPTQARQLGRQATRVLLMVMEPPRVLLMMMEPPCVRCRLACARGVCLQTKPCVCTAYQPLCTQNSMDNEDGVSIL